MGNSIKIARKKSWDWLSFAGDLRWLPRSQSDLASGAWFCLQCFHTHIFKESFCFTNTATQYATLGCDLEVTTPKGLLQKRQRQRHLKIKAFLSLCSFRNLAFHLKFTQSSWEGDHPLPRNACQYTIWLFHKKEKLVHSKCSLIHFLCSVVIQFKDPTCIYFPVLWKRLICGAE